MTSIHVRPIDAATHLAFLEGPGAALPHDASFLQHPCWAGVKVGWRSEGLGWFRSDALVGVGLASYRDVPGVGALAYLAEGPVLDWTSPDVGAALDALLVHLRGRRVFTVRMTPAVPRRRWRAATVRAALGRQADPAVRRLRDLPPDEVDPTGERLVALLSAAGWRAYEAPGPGFGGRMHPRYRAWIGLDPSGASGPAEGDRDPDALLATLPDAGWRRNLRRSTAVVTRSDGTAPADLADFHRVYAETGERDGFPPLPPAYFERLLRRCAAERPDRAALHLARVDGEVHAAAIALRTARTLAYVYGASTTAGRPARPSNAMQAAMLRDAIASGAERYDLRGVSDSLDPDDPLVGLLRFKAGLGADAVELVGEWELALRPLRHRLVSAYLARR